MAAPRVFISSTFYDLKQIRSDVGSFIESLGYDAIMHERSEIPFAQQNSLDVDCCREVSTCDIVVCVIGKMFGSKASDSELSITMRELEQAFKDRKLVYVFIDKEVYCENKIYRKNKGNGFVPAVANDIHIHDYILQLEEKVCKYKPILQFESAEDIVKQLRGQLAGLFQYYIQREVSMSYEKTAYELHHEIDNLKSIIQDVARDHETFCNRFASTVLVKNPVIERIGKALGAERCGYLIPSKDALMELMSLHGYSFNGIVPHTCEGSKDDSNEYFQFSKTDDGNTRSIFVITELFSSTGDMVLLNKERRAIAIDEDESSDIDDLPF